MEGEKMKSYKKEFLKLKCFSPLKILTSLLFEDSWSFLSFFNTLSSSFSFFFSMHHLLRTWGFDDIRREKSLLQKLLFK
jgi:hypothetical protein